MGNGCPDLLVAKQHTTWLLEVKDGKKKPSQRKLTDDQIRFRATWHGDVFTVETIEEALNTVVFETGYN